MNIFVLDTDPILAAKYHHNAHVVKMILESAQIMSTAVSVYGGETYYKPTHAKHPCTIWAAETKSNWAWLKVLAICLCKEYTYRYGKIHKSESIIRNMVSVLIPSGNLTPFAQAMPDECKVDGNAVEAYRKYYKHHKNFIKRNGVLKPVEWKFRDTPEFMKDTYDEIIRN